MQGSVRWSSMALVLYYPGKSRLQAPELYLDLTKHLDGSSWGKKKMALQMLNGALKASPDFHSKTSKSLKGSSV